MRMLDFCKGKIWEISHSGI